MIDRLLKLLGIRRDERGDDSQHESRLQKAVRQDRARASAAAKPAAKPPAPESEPLIRNRYVREDTGTHETLTILDDSMVDSGEEPGFDPYNTGDFDRSKNWERRFRS